MIVADTYSKMTSEVGMRSVARGGADEYRDELEILLGEQQSSEQEANYIAKELSIFRSGSAPPSVEGSLSGLSGVSGGGVGVVRSSGLSEEEFKCDPTYINYYYSNVNLNPRLPPPMLSKEDWRLAQHLQAVGDGVRAAAGGGVGSLSAVGDRRDVIGGSSDDGGSGEGSLFSVQPEFGGKKEETLVDSGKEWVGGGLSRLQGTAVTTRRKSFAEIIQVKLRNFTRSCSGLKI